MSAQKAAVPKVNSKAVVLLSGGLDSGYNIVRALRDFEVVLALTADSGQRACRPEINAAKALCRKYHVPHKTVKLSWLETITHTSLVNTKCTVPTGSKVALSFGHRATTNAKNVWVPNRNGVFINIAAAFAESLGASAVIIGFNKEEASTFPDNSASFLRRANQALRLSTLSEVQLHCYSINMNKTEIVKASLRLGIDLGKLWPCYFGGKSWCKKCESCQRFARAAKQALPKKRIQTGSAKRM